DRLLSARPEQPWPSATNGLLGHVLICELGSSTTGGSLPILDLQSVKSTAYGHYTRFCNGFMPDFATFLYPLLQVRSNAVFGTPSSVRKCAPQWHALPWACLLIVGLCSSMIEVCHNGLDLRSSRMHSESELNHFCQRMRAVKAARLVIAAAL